MTKHQRQPNGTEAIGILILFMVAAVVASWVCGGCGVR